MDFLPDSMSSISDVGRLTAALKAAKAAKEREENPRPLTRFTMVSMDMLLNAAANDDVITARVFLEHGANVNVEDEERWRPLHHAAHTGSHRVLQLLLRAPGVDVNAASNKRWRPIDVCITGEAARMLLNAGAVQSPEKPGSLSALHHAAANARLDVVEVLLARGAKLSETCSPEATRKAFNGEQFGGTALHYASMGLAVARCIKSNMGSSFDVVSPELASAQDAGVRRAAICAALVRAGADIDERTIPASVRRGEVPDTDSWPMTPLALAAQAGDAPVIKALLHAGAKVDQIVVDEAGIAALHLAAYLGNTDAIRALVAGGADVRSTPSPLLGAVSHNRHSAVRALLELGADSSGFASILARPAAQRPRPFMNVDETTCALVAQHRSGRMMPARACSLPDCDARRQADYDDKRLLKCPCKLAYYCCREHQLRDRKRHKDACKAALAAQEPL